MTHNELTMSIFWQLISFAKLNQNPHEEFETFPISFEIAKTKGIKNTLNAFKTLQKNGFLQTTSPIFKTVFLTPKAFLLTKKEGIKAQTNKNNYYIALAEEKGKHEIAENLRQENELIKILTANSFQ